MRGDLNYHRRRRLVVAGIMAVGALPLFQTSLFPAQADVTATKGSFAFYYAPRLTEDEIAWLKRFDIVVIGDILPRYQTLELKRSGAKLFFYDWLTGFYLDRTSGKPSDKSWEAFVYRKRPHWLLNPEKPDSGPDGKGRAYYYDPFHPDLRFARAKRLAETLQSSSYDGVFFDLVGFPSVPNDLQQVYQERHPDMPYDQALSGFLRSLKRLRPDALIFTNQGYRNASAYFPASEYDLSESLMTSYVWGEKVKIFLDGEGLVERRETFYRKWEELKRLTDSIAGEIRKYNPKLKIYHLNYVNPLYLPTGRTEVIDGKELRVFRKELDRPAVHYGYAAAKLWGHESYSASIEELRFGQDETYFLDLGHPLGESYEERDGVVRRYYEKGVAVLNPSAKRQSANLSSPLIPRGAKRLWDCYEKKALDGFTVTLDPTVSSASGQSYPAGRIYLYLSD